MRVRIRSKVWKEWNGETGVVIASRMGEYNDTHEPVMLCLIRLDNMPTCVMFARPDLVEIK